MASAWPGGIDSVPDIVNPTVTDCNVAPTLSTRLNLATDAVTAIETWLQANVSSWVPPSGMITQFAGSTAPAGWLICDGSLVSQTTYPNLFAVCGTTYGPGGAGTFNLPDLRGRSALGAGSGSGLTSRTLGQRLGEENHALVVTEEAAHSHNIPTGQFSHAHGTSDPQHTHSIETTITNLQFGSSPQTMIFGPGGTPIGIITSSSTGLSISANVLPAGNTDTQGSGIGHNTIHPVTVVNMIIKT